MSPGTSAQAPPARRQRALIPSALLVASTDFGERIDAERVAAALARGLARGGRPGTDVCPLAGAEHDPARLRELLESLGFDARAHRARAVVVASPELDERTLAGSAAFEIATRARQAGVPAYAVTARDELGAFDARVLDLQLVLEARDEPALVAAGAKLARLA